jgi:hypothetical protein
MSDWTSLLWYYTMDGVWGENSSFNDDFNGGPQCAS